MKLTKILNFFRVTDMVENTRNATPPPRKYLKLKSHVKLHIKNTLMRAVFNLSPFMIALLGVKLGSGMA